MAVMLMLLGSISLLILTLAGYSLITTYIRLTRAYKLAHGAPHHDGNYQLGNKTKPQFKLLVLGDSIGAGHGIARFEDAVGTRLATKLGEEYYVTYVNRAGLGKWIGDVLTDHIEGRWDLIIQITACNDILHGLNNIKFRSQCMRLAKSMKQHSNKVIIAGPGDAAGDHLFPWWLRLVFKKRQRAVVKAFARAAASIDAVYVNTLEIPDLVHNLAADGIHLDANGDRILYEAIWKAACEKGWF